MLPPGHVHMTRLHETLDYGVRYTWRGFAKINFMYLGLVCQLFVFISAGMVWFLAYPIVLQQRKFAVLGVAYPIGRTMHRHVVNKMFARNSVLFALILCTSHFTLYTTNGAMLTSSPDSNRISRERGNILKNLTGTQEYENHIVTSRLDASEPVRMMYRGLREVYNRLLGPTGTRDEGVSLQARVPPYVPFPCDVRGYRSPVPPTSVHQLRPGDIDVVAALGDSLTSATGANSRQFWELLIDNRGLSWCIGGQETWRTHLTLPNILKEFNPRLFGYSFADSYNVHLSSQFNVAEIIATTSDMPYNAASLVERMKADPRVNWRNHWKLLTLMIGGNDFCSDICYQTNATEWINRDQEKYLLATLHYLKKVMPRTLVNLVPSPLINLSFSIDKVKAPLTCQFVRPIECSCLYGPKYSSQRNLYRQLERRFVKIMERVSHRAEFHTNDFTVVYQPFYRDASIFHRRDGKPDISIMAIDCVHLSQKGHAVSANGLWNNMLEPTGHKTTVLRELFENFKCPTPENPFIKTYYNS